MERDFDNCHLRDGNVVAYHDSWVYFAHRFGLNIDIFLEPGNLGIPPSPSHLVEVIQEMKARHVRERSSSSHSTIAKSLRKSPPPPRAKVVDSPHFRAACVKD